MLDYTAPSTVEEAVRILAEAPGTAKVLSGGTDLLVQLRSGRAKHLGGHRAWQSRDNELFQVLVERKISRGSLSSRPRAAQRTLELRQKEAATDAGLTREAFTDREKLLKRVPG